MNTGKKRVREFFSYLGEIPDLKIEQLKLSVEVDGKIEFMYISYDDSVGWTIKFKTHEGRGIGPVEAIRQLMRFEDIEEQLYDIIDFDTDSPKSNMLDELANIAAVLDNERLKTLLDSAHTLFTSRDERKAS